MHKRKYITDDYPKLKWLEFNPVFHKASIKLDQAGYFDERPQLIFTLTTMIALFGCLIFPFFGMWWSALISFIIFLFVPWGYVFLSLPIKTGINECESKTWGFYFYSVNENEFPTELWIRYGRKSKVIYFPWDLVWHKTSLLLIDQESWIEETEGNYKEFYLDEFKDPNYVYSFNYKYSYSSDGLSGHTVTATCRVIKREFRRRLFKWTTLFNHVSTKIDIDFDQEVGRGRGSWKGGTIGCSYVIEKGENALDAIKRMERTRKF